MESAAFNSVRTEMTFTSLQAPSSRASCLLGFISLEEEGSFTLVLSLLALHTLQNSLFRCTSMAQGHGKETAEKQFFLVTGLKLYNLQKDRLLAY